MGARAMWKGVIRLEDLSVPVKLYSALEDRAIHFKLLHEPDQQPIVQEMYDPNADRAVARDDIQRGLEIDGRMVILSPEDLAEAAPEASRDIEILRFVPLAALDDPWYDRPYWLGPDGQGDHYAAFVAALEAEERMAIVRWVMRNKRYQAAIRARGGHLALVRLRHAEEIIAIEDLQAPSGRTPDARELALAEQLIAALEDELDVAALTDEYRERLEELIEAKAAGKVVQLPTPRKKDAAEGSLLEALTQSLKVAKGA